MNKILSDEEVLARLFAPTSNMAETRGKKPMHVVSAKWQQEATYADLESLMRSAFSHLSSLGVAAEDNVVFCCENRLEFFATLLACWALKATTTLIDYRTHPREVFEVCEKLEAKLLFTSISTTDLAFNGDTHERIPVRLLRPDEINSSQPRISASCFDFKDLDLDRPSLALFTSGTTGAPKTALHSLRTLVRNIVDLSQVVDMQPDATALTPLPVSHIFGLTVLLVTQALGMTTVLTELNPVTFVKAVYKYKPEVIAALPQFYGALLSAPAGVINLKEAKLLLTGGAPLAVSLASKFEETFGKRLNNGYGSTESKIFALNKDGPVLSVGKALGQVKIDIVDTVGSTLPDGMFGEVRISSSTLMDCYLNDDEKTKSVLRDGKYYTGDYGRLEQGYLFVAGRKDDLVSVAGVAVHAAEVEEVLRNYSQVKDVAVTAVANKRLGEVVRADVVVIDEELADGLKSTDPAQRRDTKRQLVRQFKAYCASHLSRHKRPMIWNFLGPHDDLPKTLAGKVDKKELENQRSQTR